MTQDDLERQLKRLSERLDRIERRLGLATGADEADDVSGAEGVAPRAEHPPLRVEPPPVTPPAAPAPPSAPPPTPPPLRHVPATPAPSPVPPASPAPVVKRRPPSPRAPLELLIGGRWMAWVGAIVVVLGVGFLVKLGVDAGWWGHLPPLARCLLVAGLGGALVVAGEVVLRRVGPAASVGLFGAGLGALYLDAFAAFEWFSPPLVSREWAFILMAVAALIGFGITLHTAFVTIGVLSIIGGYLTPWLLHGATTNTLEVGSYLTMLLGISLALSAVRPKNFRPLRYVALGGQALVGLSWAVEAARSEWIVVMLFITMWWAIVLAEAVVAAVRRQSSLGNVFASLLSTAWFVTVGCWLLAATQPTGFDWLGSFTVAVAAVAAASAAQFGPGMAALRDPPRTAMDKLAVALWAQAGVLLAVAVALQFDGYGQSIGWLAIALASIEIGRRLGSRGVDVFGLIVGALALLRVAVFDWQLPGMDTQLLAAGQLSVTNWSILALVAVLATHLAAHRLREQPPHPWNAMPIVLAGLGTVGWMALCMVQAKGLAITGGWLAGSVALLAAHRFGRRQRYFEIGLLVLLAAAARWLILDAIVQRADPAWDPTATLPVINWQMGLAAAIACVGWWASRLFVRRSRAGADLDAEPISIGWQVAIIAGIAFVLIGLSFELDHVVKTLAVRGRTFPWSFGQLWQLLLTLLWAVGSVGVGLLARSLLARDPSGVRSGGRSGPHLLVRFAWSVLIICAVKWLVFDTLYWALLIKSGRTIGVWPVANVQMLVGGVIAASAFFLYAFTAWSFDGRGQLGDDVQPRSVWSRLGASVPAAAAVLVLWGLTFEVDRALGRFEAAQAADWEPLWNPLHLRALWWTLLWATGGVAMMLWTRLHPTPAMLLGGWVVLAFSAIVWLGYDTIGWRITDGPALAPVVFNLQFAVGALVAAILGVAMWTWSRSAAGSVAAPSLDRRTRLVGLGLIGLIGLWLGSLEIDRFFAAEPGGLPGTAAMARQAWLSIYWGLYAIALIGLGFVKRSAAARYAGLALLVLTLGKVLTVDMAGVRYVYRVVSLLGVGMLLVTTSVAYMKLAPRLLAGSSPPREAEE